ASSRPLLAANPGGSAGFESISHAITPPPPTRTATVKMSSFLDIASLKESWAIQRKLIGRSFAPVARLHHDQKKKHSIPAEAQPGLGSQEGTPGNVVRPAFLVISFGLFPRVAFAASLAGEWSPSFTRGHPGGQIAGPRL